jgi:hypothetical protein
MLTETGQFELVNLLSVDDKIVVNILVHRQP